jgi:hypothetical protein
VLCDTFETVAQVFNDVERIAPQGGASLDVIDRIKSGWERDLEKAGAAPPDRHEVRLSRRILPRLAWMDKSLKTLTVVYAWALALLILAMIGNFHTGVRAFMLLLGYLPVSVVHLKISIGNRGGKARGAFTALTILWAIQTILAVPAAGPGSPYSSQAFLADLMSLLVLMAIAALVSISSLLNLPFFYTSTKSKTLVAAGILGLLCTLLIGIMLGISLVDLYRSH